MDDERREKLFQHVAIFLEQQAEELPHVVAHDVHLQPFNDARILDRFITDIKTDDRIERQHMHATQVKVRVRRWKSVKMGTADSGEQQRIRLRSDNAVKAWVNGHGFLA